MIKEPTLLKNLAQAERNLQDFRFMKEALKEAKKAYDKEEVPVGAVIVIDNKVKMSMKSYHLPEIQKIYP